MKDKYHEQWEKLGADDPYWAVLTDPKKKGGKWDHSDFFNSGEKAVIRLLKNLEDLDVELRYDSVLDFGCGVGRVSRAFASRFKQVIAIDVSSTMLDEARKANRHVDNINFIHNTAEDLSLIPSDSVDCVYTNMVLQHMSPRKQLAYIRGFCKVLSSGGIMAIQASSYFNLKSWEGWRQLVLRNNILNVIFRAKDDPLRVMEMHVLSKHIVLETLSQEGMEIIHVERNNTSGPGFQSYMYFAKKC